MRVGEFFAMCGRALRNLACPPLTALPGPLLTALPERDDPLTALLEASCSTCWCGEYRADR